MSSPAVSDLNWEKKNAADILKNVDVFPRQRLTPPD